LHLVPVEELNYQQQQQQHHQQHQGSAPQFSFQSIPGLTSYNNTPHTVDPLDFCFVPDVARQQQQMFAEIMLHHDQHHHITPTATVPSSNSASIHPASTVQYYSNGTNTAALAGNHSFTEMLGFELNFLGSSVNHQNGNGLESDQYLQ